MLQNRPQPLGRWKVANCPGPVDICPCPRCEYERTIQVLVAKQKHADAVCANKKITRMSNRYKPVPDGPLVRQTVVNTNMVANAQPIWSNPCGGIVLALPRPVPGAWQPCCGRGYGHSKFEVTTCECNRCAHS